MQPRVGDGAGGSRRDAIVASIAGNVLTHIPQPFNIPAIEKTLRSNGPPDRDLTPSEVVLLQELEHWNRLVNVMKQVNPVTSQITKTHVVGKQTTEGFDRRTSHGQRVGSSLLQLIRRCNSCLLEGIGSSYSEISC